MNIKQALENAIKILKENNINESILKARILLANVLKQPKEYLIIHEQEELNSNEINKYKKDIQKLSNGIPIQYITNKQEFMGLEFYVDKNVLIPQPDTEILVEEVIDIAKREERTKILDLCTGSGAIGISIAKNIESCEVTLLDIDKYALEVAEKNSKYIVGTSIARPKNNEKRHNDYKIKIIQSDLFENIKSKFDIIVSNPPYIKTDIIKTLDKEVQNEPILALDGGKDGLNVYRKIINQAHKYLKNNGYLCLEIGYDQKEEIIKLIQDTNNYKDIYSKKDLSRNDRIVICKNCQKSIE